MELCKIYLLIMENLEIICKYGLIAEIIYCKTVAFTYLIIFLNWFWYRKESKLTLESCRDVKNNVTAYITLFDRPHNMWFITKFAVFTFAVYLFFLMIASLILLIVSVIMNCYKL